MVNHGSTTTTVVKTRPPNKMVERSTVRVSSAPAAPINYVGIGDYADLAGRFNAFRKRLARRSFLPDESVTDSADNANLATPSCHLKTKSRNTQSTPKITSMAKIEPVIYKGATLEKTLYKYITEDVEAFQAETDDIVLSTFPKCGTTWIKAIASSIRHFDRQEDPLKKSVFFHVGVPTIDYTSGGDKRSNATLVHLTSKTPPRLYHCHLPYQALPESIHKNGCRIIYVARNPKDCVLSTATFIKIASEKWPTAFWTTDEMANAPLDKLVEGTVDNFLSKDGELYGPFTKHALSYWNASHGIANRILFLHYEELKRDPFVAVRRIADFMGRSDLSDDDIRLVVERTQFDTLRSTSMASTIPGAGDISERVSVYFVKGRSGGWKECLSDEQSDKIDRHTEAALEGSTLRFQYE